MTARKVRQCDGRGKKDQPLERSWSFFPAAAAVCVAELQYYRLANCAMYRS